MILNTPMHGIVAAIVCLFLLYVAWKAAHQYGDKENMVAVLLAMLGAVSGLLAFTWISDGL
jgi:uncharacterized membrane protein